MADNENLIGPLRGAVNGLPREFRQAEAERFERLARRTPGDSFTDQVARTDELLAHSPSEPERLGRTGMTDGQTPAKPPPPTQ